MNNQRRHQLERNVLAEKIGEGYEKSAPAVKPILVLAIVGLLGFLGFQFYKRTTSKESAQQWSEFYYSSKGGTADSFADLAEMFPNSTTGRWAKHAAAQGYLRDGIEALYVNRKEGVENVRKAIELWQSLKNSDIAELRNAATLGLAQAHESLGELDDAIKNYQIVSDLPTNSDLQKQRFNEQITYLKSAEAKNFFEWFNKLDPKPEAKPIFSGDLNLPPINPSLSLDPNLPKLNTPIVPAAEPSLTPPAGSTDTPAKPAEIPATPPAAEATPPAGDAPSGNSPSADAPSADAPTGSPAPAESPAAPAESK